MTDREKIINEISNVLLMHGCLSEEIISRIYIVLDDYLFIADLLLLDIAETLSQMTERKDDGQTN